MSKREPELVLEPLGEEGGLEGDCCERGEEGGLESDPDELVLAPVIEARWLMS